MILVCFWIFRVLFRLRLYHLLSYAMCLVFLLKLFVSIAFICYALIFVILIFFSFSFLFTCIFDVLLDPVFY